MSLDPRQPMLSCDVIVRAGNNLFVLRFKQTRLLISLIKDHVFAIYLELQTARVLPALTVNGHLFYIRFHVLV